MATYVDLLTLHNPATGTVIPASWGDQIRENEEFMIDPPGCSVYKVTANSVSDGVDTALTATAENFDNASMHDNATNPSRITAPIAGRYLFTASVHFTANSTGRRLVYFDSSTAAADLMFSGPTAASPTTLAVCVSKMYVLAANDFVEVVVNQNSGGALDVRINEFASTFLTR